MKKKLLLALLSMLLLPLGVIAQNVSISPNSGSLVASVGDNGQTGFALGLSALWRHEQLAISMTAADRDALFDNGEISFPSPVLGVRNDKLVMLGGHRPTYIVVSLPKGYRITGYKLVLVNDIRGNLGGSFTNTNGNQEVLHGGTGVMRFFETKPWKTNTTNSRTEYNPDEGFNLQNYPGYNETYVRYIEPGSWDKNSEYIGTPESDIIAWAKNGDDKDINTNDVDLNKEFTIERHSMTDTDMGNQLYFRLVKNFSYYGLSIKSFNIDFTAEGTFDTPVAPAEIGEARMVAQVPFQTSKTDIGAMERRTQTGTNYTFFSYDYENVSELTAYNYLYQQGAVVKNGEGAGKPQEVAGVEKHIHPVYVDGQNRYAFKNDLYYVEPPISVGTSSGLDAPIGYRVVGAKFKYLWGTETNGGTQSIPNAVQIYYDYSYTTTTYGWNGRTTTHEGRVWLNNLRHFSESETNTTWQIDDDGYIYNDQGYLSCNGDDDLFRTISYSTAEPGTDAAKWHLRIDSSNGNLYYQDSEGIKYYLQATINGQQTDNQGRVTQTAGQVNTSVYPNLYKNVEGNTGLNTPYFAHTIVENKEVTLSPFHPGTYTLKVYGKEGAFTYYTTKEEADAHNAELTDAVAAGDDIPEDYATKVGSAAVGALTAEEAAAYNATLTGYVEAGDEVPADYEAKVGSAAAGETLTAAEAAAYNAKLEGAVETGDVKSTISPVFQKTVSSINDVDTYELKNLNNDAVAFEISGLESGKEALVEVTLQLQALDPYINSMNIVCTDVPKELQMIQTFTANDFRVSGGEFIFYVPAKYRGQMMNLEFSNLRSDYADETYPTGSNMHYSRYSFVTSEYFYPINGDGNDGLYDVAYSPDASYENKIIATTAGNIRYKFNNAEDIGTGTTGSAYLIEYPFSVEKYLGSADPDKNKDGTPTGKTGEFINCQVKAGNGAQEFGTFYLFTADEPRYNIAPTKALQHRSYAFYRMDVKVVAKDYDPVFAWTKIYNSSLYGDDDKTDSQWGLTVTTKDKTTQEVVTGYLTYEDIIDHLDGCPEPEYYTKAEADAWNTRLEGAITSGTVLTAEQASAVNAVVTGANYAAGGTITAAHAAAYNAELPDAISEGDVKKAAVESLLGDNTDAPKTTEQILYVDGSDLLYILEDEEISETTLKNKLGTNALIFLPLNVTSEVDNVAFMTDKSAENVKSFKAGKNIVLTDKQPFFTPYNIQVASANYATYTRLISDSRFGKDALASIILPFTLTLSGGKHTNDDGSGAFWVSKLGSGTISLKDGSDSDYGTAYFQRLSDATTEANNPYMIEVDKETVPAETTISFIAKQSGSTIMATPTTGVTTGDNHTGTLITGEATNVTFKNDATIFTNSGTYSGARFDRTNNRVFYFANQQFVSMNELNSNRKYMYVDPFRGIYTYPANLSREFSLRRFDISFDEPSIVDVTGITDTNNEADLMIRTGKGSMTFTAIKAQEVTIYAVNGARVAKASMQGGDTKTVNLPSGVYIVNNVKIAVK